jgi:hypothetical protein
VASGCGGASVDPVLPQAEIVKVGKEPPPEGARALGPIDVAHGSGCGLLGDRGSYEGAVALARDRAAAVGGDYVELLTVSGPHFTPTCYDNRYVVHGIAFKLAGSSGSALSRPTVGAEPKGCDPPCSPGYVCRGGSCVALCNPPCAEGQACKQDRTCGVSLATVFEAPAPLDASPEASSPGAP